jgi:hypothetical protein
LKQKKKLFYKKMDLGLEFEKRQTAKCFASRVNNTHSPRHLRIKGTILHWKCFITFFLLYQNWFKNKNKSSLEAKEAQENNFEWYAMDFVPKTNFEKKKLSNLLKIAEIFDIFEISKLV